MSGPLGQIDATASLQHVRSGVRTPRQSREIFRTGIARTSQYVAPIRDSPVALSLRYRLICAGDRANLRRCELVVRVDLPGLQKEHVKGEDAVAAFKNGVLEIEMPAIPVPEVKKRTVEIKG